MTEARIKPSRAAYALPVLIFVVGMCAFAQILWVGLSGISEKLPQMMVPGRKVLSFAETGTYTVFHEHESVIGNRVVSSRGVELNVECAVTAEATGDEISLTRPGMNSTYTMGGREGQSVLEFRIAKPGRYEFACKSLDGSEEPVAVFAVGHGFMEGLFGTIALALLFFFGAFGAGAGSACWIWWKRQQSKVHTAIPPPGVPPPNVPLG